MKDESLLKYLYDHFDEMNFGFRPDTKNYRDACKERDDALRRLEESVPKEVISKLEKYIESESRVVYMELKENYMQGICLGVRFISEAFVLNKNQIDI